MVHRLVSAVTEKALVAAIAVERDGHPAARQFRDVIGRDRRRVGERLAIMPDQPRQHRNRIGLDDELLVIGRIALRHHPRVAGLVVFLAEKPIEKVFTVPPPTRAIIATTAEESTPPERKAPSGTSETSLSRTASSSWATSSRRSSSIARRRLTLRGSGKRQ